ncbi:MAG TPA: hypothetical protein VF077_00355 [Nitrospiraceae bacterium]
MIAPDLVVGVLVPSGDTWRAKMALSMLGMTMHFLSVRYMQDGDQAIFFRNKRGSTLTQNRQRLVMEALNANPRPTHLLLVDQDQTFEPDLLHRLLVHDAPVVACNVATKATPSQPTARLKAKNGGDPTLVYTTPTSPALGEVWRIGCGIMLVQAWVFSMLPKPWFFEHWLPDEERFEGEDWGLCQRLEEAGIPILIDHRASITVGHDGGKVYTHRDAWEDQDDGCRVCEPESEIPS